MTKKGVEFARECLIFEVCQPQQLKEVLEQNMSVSTALPCRISIYKEGGKAILTTLKPTTLLAMFNTQQLKGVAQEMEDTIVKSPSEKRITWRGSGESVEHEADHGDVDEGFGAGLGGFVVAADGSSR
jgi:hypothetical protein